MEAINLITNHMVEGIVDDDSNNMDSVKDIKNGIKKEDERMELVSTRFLRRQITHRKNLTELLY